MIDIAINNMSKAYFSDFVFNDVSIELKIGERVGLLGDNGTGKSTLFKIISGIENYDSGELFIRNNINIGYLKQLPDIYQDIKVIGVLNLAFKEVIDIRIKIKELEKILAKSTDFQYERNLKQFGELQEKYEHLGGYEIEEKLARICKGLKIDKEMQAKSYNLLSGGEKTRVMLGKLLLEEPDVLLLDEPTNHLDIETTEWLEKLLNDYKGSTLIISHDRYFLDRVITKIYEIKAGKTDIYYGNYSNYLKEREIRYENQLKHYEAQQKKIAQMEDAAKTMRVWASQADNEMMFKKAKAMEKRIERMDKIDKPIKNLNDIKITYELETKAGKIIAKAKNYILKINDNILAKDVSFEIYNNETVALIGANGTGKSTLIKDLVFNTDEDRKDLTINPRAKIGYLEQDIVFKRENVSILDVFKDYHPLSEGEIRNYLAKFKFRREEVFNEVSKLSGGERVRLMLAILMKRDINFLILDEPTNHIDIKTREIFEEALENYKGTILFISHDRYFINKLADRVMEIEKNMLYSYIGNYEYYKSEKEKRINLSDSTKSKENKKQKESIKINSKSHTKRKNNYKIKEIEEEISALEEEIEKKKIIIRDNPTNYQLLQDELKDIENLEVNLEKKLKIYYEIV